jgi:hypothetical protein
LFSQSEIKKFWRRKSEGGALRRPKMASEKSEYLILVGASGFEPRITPSGLYGAGQRPTCTLVDGAGFEPATFRM